MHHGVTGMAPVSETGLGRFSLQQSNSRFVFLSSDLLTAIVQCDEVGVSSFDLTM